MKLISKLVTNSSGVSLSGLRVRITRLGGNTPCPYAFTETGNIMRDGNTVLPSTGILTVWVTDDRGARVTVFHSDNTIAFQEDVRAPFEASGIEVSTKVTDELAVPVPVALELGFNAVTLAAAATRTVDLLLVYSDGTVVRNPSSGVTATTMDADRVTVVAATRTLTAVNTGAAANVQFVYTLGYIQLSDIVAVTVS
jgi:hypothetical protein